VGLGLSNFRTRGADGCLIWHLGHGSEARSKIPAISPGCFHRCYSVSSVRFGSNIPSPTLGGSSICHLNSVGRSRFSANMPSRRIRHFNRFVLCANSNNFQRWVPTRPESGCARRHLRLNFRVLTNRDSGIVRHLNRFVCRHPLRHLAKCVSMLRQICDDRFRRGTSPCGGTTV
jgi:hypothetical protein